MIADAWDATFTLYDGEPDAATIAAMHPHVSTQEEGRHRQGQLTLSRANKSVRMFEHVVGCLAEGRQPDPEMVNRIGYLMRTTAVYGNGKFGISDRDRFVDRDAMAAPFMAEMLTVYLIRHFSLLLVAHLARQRGGDQAADLDPRLARHFGIGNATGLGMAPFLVNHQALLHQWIVAREKAYARVLEVPSLTEAQHRQINALIGRARTYTAEWRVDDRARWTGSRALKPTLTSWRDGPGMSPSWAVPTRCGNWHKRQRTFPSRRRKCWFPLSSNLLVRLWMSLVMRWQRMKRRASSVAARLPISTPHWPHITAGPCKSILLTAISPRCSGIHLRQKLEPRLGKRFEEDGAECEFPFDIPHQVQAAAADLATADDDMLIADFMMRYPQHRFILRRVMETAAYPYGEIEDNLVAVSTRPIDMLRCKLSFFGASKFDPKSDLWTRITLYQGRLWRPNWPMRQPMTGFFRHLDSLLNDQYLAE